MYLARDPTRLRLPHFTLSAPGMYAGKLFTTMVNFGYKATCRILLCRRGEVLSALRVFVVLKRGFTVSVSLSLLDVLFGSRWCFCFVCLGFASVFVLYLNIQSFAYSPALQLEIS